MKKVLAKVLMSGGQGARPLMLTRCPVCGDELRVVKLSCEGCQTSLKGQFSLGWVNRLSQEQLRFVEVFLKCRGKIKDVEQELGLSYPTVVARLGEVIEAMGYEVPPESSAASSQRQKILDDLAAGQITAAEAANRLRALQ